MIELEERFVQLWSKIHNDIKESVCNYNYQ